MTNIEWTPFIRLNLSSVSSTAFGEVMPKLLARGKELKAAGTLPPLPFDKDGWFNITPQMAETALMHSGGNRECLLQTVKAYAADMAADNWPPTGQPIIASGDKLEDGHTRLLAAYLGGHTFRCFVVVSAPAVANRFAYLDSGKTRTGKDTLYIAGWNSTGGVLANIIRDLALRYDENKLGVQQQPRFRSGHPINNRDILNYMHDHPDLREAAQTMLGTFPEAVSVIGNKGAAIFFAWLVLQNYDLTVLEAFCVPLGSGALLAEDSPILAARNKFLEAEDCHKKKTATRLAYLCKAFLMHFNKQQMPRTRTGRIQPLSIGVDEPFPRIEQPVLEQAAE